MSDWLSSQRGQTAVEYMGVLLIVALVIAAIAASGIASTIADAVERQVACVSQQSSDCGDASGPSARSADPEGSAPRPTLVDARRVADPTTFGVAVPRIPRYGVLGDALDAFLDLLEGPSPVVEIDGYLVPVELLGPALPVGAIRRLFGLSSAAYNRAARAAKRLGIRTEVLLAGQKATAGLVDELARLLPEAARGRVTLAVGVGKDARGRLKLIAGSSEPNGYMRPAVEALLRRRKIDVATGSSGHAERQVLAYMRRQGLKPVTIGASRPICRPCADAIRRAGATAATRLKPRPRPTRPG